MKRLIIHTKDIMIITGKSERYSRTIIHQIKETLHKKPHQYVTIKEFCTYMGLDIDEVYSVIH